MLLFGKNIETISLRQVLYLLNEKNLDKGFIEFRNGFNELKEDDLIVEGEFSNFNEVKKSIYYKKINEFSISTEEFQHSIAIEAFNYDDTL